MGKIVYMPKGAASEYSKYAANFYIGCMGKNSCKYCYCPGILRGYWPDVPTLKKSLVNETTAYQIFCKEVNQNIDELRKHGLFFNFVSDPFLKETYSLNMLCIRYCLTMAIPVKTLTKQTWWVDNLLRADYNVTPFISFGFTLTGHDDLEPGAATNQERIEAMKKLHDAGFKTWASIEPIIDLESSMDMVKKTIGFCDLYKIGLKSGDKHRPPILYFWIKSVLSKVEGKIYFKDSLLKQSGITRESLPSNCVNRDFNL